MKKAMEFTSRMMAIMIMAGILLLPLMVNEAIADSSCPGSQCVNGSCLGGADVGQTCSSTPEMSDYLAMAFVVLAGGMVYYFRRRALAATQ